MKRRLAGLFSMLAVLALALSPAAAAKKEPRIDPKDFAAFVNKTLAEWKVPGVGVAVVKGGKVVLAEGYGLRDVPNKLPVTARTIFAIGSSSKAFTATAMGILVDEGKVAWDKRVRDYLPTFRLQDESAAALMTPRDLLCHRSGLARHDLAWIGSSFSRKELRPDALPGTHGRFPVDLRVQQLHVHVGGPPRRRGHGLDLGGCRPLPHLRAFGDEGQRPIDQGFPEEAGPRASLRGEGG